MKRIISLTAAVVFIAVSLCIAVPADNYEVWTPEYLSDGGSDGSRDITSEQAPEADAGFAFYFERVPSDNGDLIFDLHLEDIAGIGLSGITADITYPDSLVLKDSKYLYTDGMCAFSQNLTDYPYRMSALIGTDVYPKFEKTPIARFTFGVKEGVQLTDDLTVGAVLDETIDLGGVDHKDETPAKDYEFVPANEIKSVSVKELPATLEYTQYTEQYDAAAGGSIAVIYWDGSEREVPLAECEITGFDSSAIGEIELAATYEGYSAKFTVTVVPMPGDVNADGKVGLADVANILKFVAGWEIEVNADIGDVNKDGYVNVSDASLMLKYIACWDVVLK